jgi:alpha-acetolactate decarboxylase
MRVSRSSILGGAAAIACLLVGEPARSQPPMEQAGLHTLPQPYDIEAFGAFRMLILAGDFSRKVDLAAATAKRPTTGVGTLTDARGEITIHDGRLIVSYGREESNQESHPAAEDESAALLATGTVTAWQAITVPHDVAPEEIEPFLSHTAAAHGLDPDGPFPFQVRGTLKSYAMHVNAAPTGGPHGMGQPIAITRELEGETIDGMVAGFYASRDLVGIVTHGGTRTHGHWVAPDLSSTAHLDRWGLKAGAVLSLPKP